ncbi:hypothetical protein RDI58_001447 [Solanum bulbocastanum]|uniref:Uncharacterized protein n=1 Tax=Solanum bulbocastanum TaxID=147425 RepID=A0AAN8U821_SOLBU
MTFIFHYFSMPWHFAHSRYSIICLIALTKFCYVCLIALTIFCYVSFFVDFSLYFYILCNHWKMHHHDKLERYNSFDNKMSTRSFICMLAVIPDFHMHYVFLMYFVWINNEIEEDNAPNVFANMFVRDGI